MKLLSIALLLSVPMTARAECLGVAIETQNGPANLMALDVYGLKDDLSKVSAEAQLMGVQAKEIRFTPTGDGMHIPFVSPRVSAGRAIALVTRVKKGEFGVLRDKLMVMDIDTLPADKCPRS